MLSAILVSTLLLASPGKAESAAGKPMDADVKKLVDAMQAFYEHNKDFEAHFEQSYKYATFNRTQQSAGHVLFRKPRPTGKAGELEAPAMRWEYEKPEPKSIVVAGGEVFQYDPGAQQLTKAPFNADKLSSSVTFLWGVGKLADEFYISKADRKDLAPGVALQLVPKKPDARFDRVFMLVDPRSNQVTQTIVVDPDGSENHMTFSGMKTDQNIPNDKFALTPPPGTQVIDMSKAGSQEPTKN